MHILPLPLHANNAMHAWKNANKLTMFIKKDLSNQSDGHLVKLQD